MGRIVNEKIFLVVGGQTGCGKTLLLNKLENSIDLEGLANHRGSAFGNNVTPQPKQIDFENAFAIELIKKEINDTLIIEDEGKNIGMIHLPDSLKNKALQSSIVILTATLEERLDISLKTYVIEMAENFCLINNISGFNNYSDYWKNSLFKIQKRLGGLRYKSLLNQLNLALESHKENNDLQNYRPLIESLLVDYYDPMYDYQISKKKQRIVFQGNSQDVLAYLDCN
jgi:Predicted ATPase